MFLPQEGQRLMVNFVDYPTVSRPTGEYDSPVHTLGVQGTLTASCALPQNGLPTWHYHNDY